MTATDSAISVGVHQHARDRFLQRADGLHLTPRVEDAWRQAHEIPGRGWLQGERARYDPTTRCVFVVRDGEIRTVIYAPTAKPVIQRSIRNAGWQP